MFGLFKSKTQIRKHKHLINLVALAKSDGRVDAKEIELLAKIATQNGIAPKAFKAILDTSETIDIDVSNNKTQRISQLFDFIQMMLVDDEVSESEKTLCINIAKKMQFKEEIINDLVNTIMKRIKNGESKETVCNALEYAL